MGTSVLEDLAASVFEVEVVTASSLEGRGSKFFQNIGTCVMNYVTSHPTSRYLNWSGFTANLKISRDKFTLWREIGIILVSVSCDQIHRSEMCPY